MRCGIQSVIAAATELNVQTVNINNQVCMRSQAEADAVRARAEAMHAKKLEERVLRLRPRSYAEQRATPLAATSLG